MKQNNIDVINTLALQVEKHLQLAIAVYQNETEYNLVKQPAPNSWSVAQCLWHVNSYARYYYPLIEKTIGKKKAETQFNSGLLGKYFTGMMNNLTTKYSAFKNHTPPKSVNPYAEVATFINDQEQLLAYLKQMENTNLNQRLPLSITGLVRLKLGDVLQFFVAHNHRHLQQANRALKA
jgi:uncharacterized damage-inducible protein DinB